MGRGIAYVSAISGFETAIIDINEQALQNAQNDITAIFEKSVVRGKLTAQQVQEATLRLTYVTDLATVANKADLIIEAVPEKGTLNGLSLSRWNSLLHRTVYLPQILQR